MSAVITGSGQSFPPAVLQQELWEQFFARHYNNSAIAKRLFASAGTNQRHAVANPIFDDVSTWATEARMQRYSLEALPLARNAVTQALAASSIEPNDVGMFVLASCTGYATPGLDTFVPRDTGMRDSVQRLVVGHMGCYAAVPGLSAVADYVTAHQKPAVLLCVELASLHVQPPTNDVEQMLVHALFSDGASAVVVEPGEAIGLVVVDVATKTDVDEAKLMTWNVTDLGFKMGLSQKVPDVLERHIRPLVDELLARHYITIDDVAGWALHPGGPRILDVGSEALQLKPEQLGESRSVLAEHGNCSSATLLVVLDEIRRRRQLERGQYVVAIAFGPGLTLYATLLRQQ